MTRQIVAQSISRSVRAHLLKTGFTAQVLGVFQRACNLVTPGGDVIALVAPQIGDGPLNVVVNGPAALFAEIEAGSPVTLTGQQLRLGNLRIDLKNAAVWEPRPDWDALRHRFASLESGLPLLWAVGCRLAPDNSLLALLGEPPTGTGLAPAVFAIAQKAGKALQAGWAGHQAELQTAGRDLAGLGSGLTPAGDDFLAGTMLWAWLAHPAPDTFCRPLLQAAAPRTTTLAAAVLRAAAQGECSQPWHRLLAALSEGTNAEIAAAVPKILAHGATSGADTLAGFLYLPTQMPQSP